MLKSEKKSLFRFLALYLVMVLLIIVVLSFSYYESEKKLILSEHRVLLSKYAYIQTKRLKVLHHAFDKKRHYPRDPRFKSAIYDLENVKIFSLLETKNIDFDKEIYMNDSHVYYIQSLSDFYLGAKYLVIEIENNAIWKDDIKDNMLLYALLAFIFFLFFGLFLAKIFLRPMRDAIVLLDRFIKDTTHELNTPLSAILANIEMMDTDVMIDKNKTKLNRINIAAKTVSVLYKDLTYLTLEQDRKNKDEKIAIDVLLEHRIEYFMILAQSKGIRFEIDLDKETIFMDKRKLTRLLDNLISNAIKYNKRKGIIGIELSQRRLIIWDTGIGIAKDKIPYIFDRYARFNESEGGFGVGLSIVKSILDEYHISIGIESTLYKGTKLVLTW